MTHARFKNLLAGFAYATMLATWAVLPSHAAPIPAGTSAADDVVFNFDLTDDLATGVTSFNSITLLYVSFSSPDATGGDMGGGGPPNTVPVTVDVFGDPDGGSLLTTLTVNILGTGAAFNSSELTLAGLLDGLFSVGLRVEPGDRASGSVSAFGEYTTPRGTGDMQGGMLVTTSPEAGVIATTPPVEVPEPTTLALIGLALLGLGAVRRRKR